MSTPLNLPCSVTVPCFPCYVSPISNLTSEAPDSEIFIGESWVPPGGPPPPPTIGGLWTATGCLGICTSTLSQADADLCAANQVAQCQVTNRPGTQLYPNTPQSCTVNCPDGSPFTYTVPAGIILLSSGQAANAAAHDLACQLADQLKICFGSINGCACVGSSYSSTVPVTGGTVPIVYTVASGSLPTGLSLSGSGHSFTVSGTPSTSGSYAFSIQGVDAVGNFMRKSYTIVVLQITTTQPSPFVIGNPYSFQLTAAGGSGGYTWSIVSGMLPTGLTMSSSGLISGTPTAPGLNPVSFNVSNSGCTCSSSLTFSPVSITLAIAPLTWNPGDTISYVGTAPAFPGDLFQIDWTASNWDGRGSSATGHFNDVGGQFDGSGNATMTSLKMMRRIFTSISGRLYWGAGPCTAKIEDNTQSPSVFSNTLNRTLTRHAAVSLDATVLAYILAHPDPIAPYIPTGTLTEEFYDDGIGGPLTAQYEDTGTAVGAQTAGAPKGILYSPNGVDLVVTYLIQQGGGHAFLTYAKLASSISNPTGAYSLTSDPNGDAPATCTIS